MNPPRRLSLTPKFKVHRVIVLNGRYHRSDEFQEYEKIPAEQHLKSDGSTCTACKYTSIHVKFTGQLERQLENPGENQQKNETS
jgi:hypothetical protein